jgi:hypothetical protein
MTQIFGEVPLMPQRWGFRNVPNSWQTLGADDVDAALDADKVQNLWTSLQEIRPCFILFQFPRMRETKFRAQKALITLMCEIGKWQRLRGGHFVFDISETPGVIHLSTEVQRFIKDEVHPVEVVYLHGCCWGFAKMMKGAIGDFMGRFLVSSPMIAAELNRRCPREHPADHSDMRLVLRHGQSHLLKSSITLRESTLRGLSRVPLRR